MGLCPCQPQTPLKTSHMLIFIYYETITLSKLLSKQHNINCNLGQPTLLPLFSCQGYKQVLKIQELTGRTSSIN